MVWETLQSIRDAVSFYHFVYLGSVFLIMFQVNDQSNPELYILGSIKSRFPEDSIGMDAPVFDTTPDSGHSIQY